jgi:hypothetical protein
MINGFLINVSNVTLKIQIEKVFNLNLKISKVSELKKELNDFFKNETKNIIAKDEDPNALFIYPMSNNFTLIPKGLTQDGFNKYNQKIYSLSRKYIGGKDTLENQKFKIVNLFLMKYIFYHETAGMYVIPDVFPGSYCRMFTYNTKTISTLKKADNKYENLIKDLTMDDIKSHFPLLIDELKLSLEETLEDDILSEMDYFLFEGRTDNAKLLKFLLAIHHNEKIKNKSERIRKYYEVKYINRVEQFFENYLTKIQNEIKEEKI